MKKIKKKNILVVEIFVEENRNMILNRIKQEARVRSF